MSVWCRAFCLRLQLKPESEHRPSSRLPALSFSDVKNRVPVAPWGYGSLY